MNISLISESWDTLDMYMNIYWNKMSFYEILCLIESNPSNIINYLRTRYITFDENTNFLNDNDLYTILSSIQLQTLIYPNKKTQSNFICTQEYFIEKKFLTTEKCEIVYDASPIIFSTEREFIANYFNLNPLNIWCPYTWKYPFTYSILYCINLLYNNGKLPNDFLLNAAIWPSLSLHPIQEFIFNLQLRDMLNDELVLQELGFECTKCPNSSNINKEKKCLKFEKFLDLLSTEKTFNVPCIIEAKYYLTFLQYYENQKIILTGNVINLIPTYEQLVSISESLLEKFNNFIMNFSFDGDLLKFSLMIQNNIFSNTELVELYDNYYRNFTKAKLREMVIVYCLYNHTYCGNIYTIYQTISDILREPSKSLKLDILFDLSNNFKFLYVYEIVAVMKNLMNIPTCKLLEILPTIEIPEYLIYFAYMSRMITETQAFILLLCSNTSIQIKSLIMKYVKLTCDTTTQNCDNVTIKAFLPFKKEMIYYNICDIIKSYKSLCINEKENSIYMNICK